jgi:hypothetical protein
MKINVSGNWIHTAQTSIQLRSHTHVVTKLRVQLTLQNSVYRGDCHPLKLVCVLGNPFAGPVTTLTYNNAETNSRLLRFYELRGQVRCRFNKFLHCFHIKSIN